MWILRISLRFPVWGFLLGWVMTGYCWHYTISSKYTVKSGYEVVRRKLDVDTQFFLQLSSLNPLKKREWKAKTSNKLRRFLWQILSGALAVNERLAYRHLHVECTCPTSSQQEETINHALFTFRPALQWWALSNLQAPTMFPSDSHESNMDYLLCRMHNRDIPEEYTRSYPWIMWYIWKSRNDKLFNNVDRTPLDILDITHKETRDWFMVNYAEGEPHPNPLNDEVTVTHSAMFTCYIDGSWKEGDQTYGVGWVLELHDGTTNLLGIHGEH